VAGDEQRQVPTEPGSYGSFYAGVAASLRDGAPPPVDPRDAVAVLEILDEARSAP
jgi:predicted dehydrogenase